MHDSLLYKEQMMEEALEAAHAAIKDLSLRVVEKASVRDQFAMAALTGMCADPELTSLCDRVAKHAYLLADAMLEARK
jgi:hypothetical protein